MAIDITELCNQLMESFNHLKGDELEMTLPDCRYCIIQREECMSRADYPMCPDFIPTDWKNHILFNGKWWN